MANRFFRYENDWASIRLVDSFVKENKAGTGNGEARLYGICEMGIYLTQV